MLSSNLIEFLPAVCEFTAVATGCWRFKRFDIPTKIFWLKTFAAFLTDSTALLAAFRYGNNMAVYSFYSLIDFILTALYFSYVTDVLRPSYWRWTIGSIGLASWVLNITYLQPLGKLSSYYMYFQGIVAIGLSLFFFFRLLLLSEDLQLGKLRHFWFSVIICLFWAITFFNWGLYDYFLANEQRWMWLINLSIIAVCALSYLGIAMVFINYPKLKGLDE